MVISQWHGSMVTYPWHAFISILTLPGTVPPRPAAGLRKSPTGSVTQVPCQRPVHSNPRIRPTHSDSTVQRPGGMGTASLRDAATTPASTSGGGGQHLCQSGLKAGLVVGPGARRYGPPEGGLLRVWLCSLLKRPANKRVRQIGHRIWPVPDSHFPFQSACQQTGTDIKPAQSLRLAHTFGQQTSSLSSRQARLYVGLEARQRQAGTCINVNVNIGASTSTTASAR